MKKSGGVSVGQLMALARLRATGVLAILLFLLALVPAMAQQQPDIPDAPSTSQPPAPAPELKTPPPGTNPTNPPNQAPPASSSDSKDEAPPGPPPPMKITTVPPGSVPKSQPTSQEQLFQLRVNVNQVVVPVRVTDESAHLVSGLLSTDFSVYEDGKKQKLNFFTSDPFALSVAVIIDLGMPDIAVQKVNETFSTLSGSFAGFDEIAIYTYSTSVSQLADFNAVGRKLEGVLNGLKTKHGEVSGVPVTGGPLGPQGPSVNGVPIDSPTTPVSTPSKQSHVLNDAILLAARDLGKRSKDRRKIIFVISDGREYRSNANYGTVLQVLLSNEVLLYGIAVESAAIPGYNKLEKLRIPGQGYSNILPKYANATGGEVLAEYSRTAIEGVYARMIGDARNQYTLGYMTRATPSDTRREIEIRVDRPGCKSSDLRPCVEVFAKEGYYPLPAR
ncbi:MAG: VWA domain-containing protein [Terriglobales bacterium]|jgi:VWFA-related protein